MARKKRAVGKRRRRRNPLTRREAAKLRRMQLALLRVFRMNRRSPYDTIRSTAQRAWDKAEGIATALAVTRVQKKRRR